MKVISNRYFILGHSECKHDWKLEKITIKSSLILDVLDMSLRLNLVKYTYDKTINNTTKEYLQSYNVGSLNKPKKRLIISLLKENQIRNNPFSHWMTDKSSRLTLTDLFEEIKNDVLIMRFVKLSKIKKIISNE